MSEPKQFSKPHQPRAQWKSRMGFILAALGSAVGLGNIWRFSYLCYDNGGGAFLVPYFIALLVVGLPVMILELALGHRMRGSAPMSFAKVNPNWEWLGWWAVNCAMYGIMLYYSAVIAWCLSYVFFSLHLSWGADPNAFFFQQYLQISSGPMEFGDLRSPVILALFGVWVIAWGVVYYGVQKGVERANKIFMPMLFVLVAVLVFWSVNLKGAAEGIAVYLTPDWSALKKPSIWVDAFTQIFFTLSLAFGIMITYASYIPRKVDLLQDAVIVCLGNSLFSFFAGFAVFGTLGYMAVTTHQPVQDVVKQSIGLAFVAYPQAISLMPAFAQVFGVLFFTALVVAGLSSAVSLIEAFSSAVIDKFHYPREVVVSAVCVTGFVGSMIFTAKSGLFWLDIVDYFITHYGLAVVVLLECFVVGWLYKASRLRKHIDQAGDVRTPVLWDIAVRYVAPVVLVILLGNDLGKLLTKGYGGYPAGSLVLIGVGWLLGALIAAFLIAQKPWLRDIHAEDGH